MTGAAPTDWYLDETSLLAEIRGSRGRLGPAPVIPGYDGLVELSRGGQGVVYAAIQRSTRRKVAIKVLLDGSLSSRSAQRRFEREIDVVASLNHPHIVRIYDSGVTGPPDERLFCVMEFIEGKPLQEHLGGMNAAMDAPPGVNSLLSLFATISEAVNHAHLHGVIHRDLKPGNIRIDPQGQPHILDFGLAKTALAPSEAVEEKSVMSVTGQFLGSLPWASPEQASGDPGALDVRSDVYSLGVMLYQFLARRFPYPVEGPVRDVLNAITTVEPQRPGAFNGAVDDEADTIVLKCLAKDPARRYQTAGELARDLRAHLAGEPIDARRDSAWYVMRRRLKRYRAAAAAAGIIAALLVASAAAFSWQAHQATIARRAAERRFDDVRELAHRFIFDFHDQIQDLAGSRQAREMLVTTALSYLEKLSAEKASDPALAAEIAAAYDRIADIQGNPFVPNLGNTTGALENYGKALAIRQGLAAAAPDDVDRHRLLARTHNSIGDVLLRTGDSEKAIAHHQQALAALEKPMAMTPGAPEVRRELAAVHVKLGEALEWNAKLPEAIAQYGQALKMIQELSQADPSNAIDEVNVSVCHSKIGQLQIALGDRAAAIPHLKEALAIAERLAAAHPQNVSMQRSVNINANALGAQLAAAGDAKAAMDHFDRALEIARHLAQIDPENALAASDLTFTHNRIGTFLFNQSRPREALPHFLAALEVRDRLGAKDPANASFQRDLAASLAMVGETLMKIAGDDSIAASERLDLFTRARDAYGRGLGIVTNLQSRGQLGAADAGLPAEFQSQFEACRQAIERSPGADSSSRPG